MRKLLRPRSAHGKDPHVDHSRDPADESGVYPQTLRVPHLEKLRHRHGFRHAVAV
eukprot:COSAG03_NODE_7668_length_887_cov_0.850254_3_plen_54_part_01